MIKWKTEKTTYTVSTPYGYINGQCFFKMTKDIELSAFINTSRPRGWFRFNKKFETVEAAKEFAENYAKKYPERF